MLLNNVVYRLQARLDVTFGALGLIFLEPRLSRSRLGVFDNITYKQILEKEDKHGNSN